jgi:hypothetical protein
VTEKPEPVSPGAATVPPLPGEDHVCVECRLRYADLTIGAAQEIIAAVSQRTRTAAMAMPEPRRRLRSRPEKWSVLEYVCHLRDVYTTSTIRLHRTRTEDCPTLEPMLNDLRARRFGYNKLDLSAVLDELSYTAAGFLDETTRLSVDDWNRTATRLPGERRTARWLARHAAHEGLHHLTDITTLGQGA